MGKFSEYDINQMEKAKQLLINVLDYNYGKSGMSSKVKRLETILAKLESLQNSQ